MKICIVYDTKRIGKATEHIVKWMAEQAENLGHNADIRKPSEVDNFGYDLFIVGSPIYYEKPMRSVVDFLCSNSEKLSKNKVALFVICMAKLFGGHSSKYINKRYIKPLLTPVEDSVVDVHIFKGWLLKPDYKQETESKDWFQSVVEMVLNQEKSMGKESDRITI